MTLVVDASVIVKLMLAEADTAVAERVFLERDLHAPSQAWLEVANALRRRGRTSARDLEGARVFLAGMPGRVTLHADRVLADRAFDLAVELDHEIYDCLYLALALALDCRLVTADGAFVAKAGKRFGARVAALRAF